MRPRPDAAENQERDDDGADDRGVASMRPRPDAAENTEADMGGGMERKLLQ